MKYDKPMCGCGHGIATHPFEGMEGLIVHVLGYGTCCREIAKAEMIPTNFRHEVWYNQYSEQSNLVEVCTVNGQCITVYTLKNQRGFNYDEEFGVWSHPKSRESINSLGDEW